MNFRKTDIEFLKLPHAGLFNLRIATGTLLFVMISFAAVAQPPYVSRLGRFQVDEVKGCAPFTVTIVNANLITTGECTGAKPCLMNYELGPQQNLFSYTYNTPGTFKLSVLYQNQSGGPDDIIITVLPNIQPTFEIYTCSARRVTVNVTDKNYDSYFVDFGDGSATVGIPFGATQTASHSYASVGTYNIAVHGKDNFADDNCNALVQSFQALNVLPTPTLNSLTSLDPSSLQLDFTAAAHLQLHLEIAVNSGASFQLYKSLYGISSTVVPNLALDNNYYCFRLSTYDPCAGTNKYSNIVCSQLFTVSAQNNVDALIWTTSGPAVNNYGITRNSTPYVNTPVTSFNDTDIVCKTNYCYQVTNNYTNGSTSISLTKCVDAIRTDIPTLINNTTAVVDDSQVELKWQQDPLYIPNLYTILRGQNSDPPHYIANTTAQLYDDASYSTEGNYCYRINYTDQCGNSSPQGDLVCPLRLTGNVDNKNVITLQWNDYTGWTLGVKNYFLEKYSQQGTLLKTIVLGTVTNYVDTEVDLSNQVVSYRLQAVPNDGALSNAISNMAKFIKGVNLFYPTAFTPNGDALNDGFTVSGQFITKIQLNIFDRWGTLIFSTDTNTPWDGTYNGRLMPETTYVWTAKVTDVAGRHLSHNGTVVLLNKPK